MENMFKCSDVDTILQKHNFQATNIIAILQDIQEVYRYLPKEIFQYLSEKLGMSRAKIYGIATFYENFSLDPKGKFIIKVCDGTACHVRKSIPILNKIREELKLSEDKTTTDDLLFSVETVSCLGACGLAPAITVNDQVHGAMTTDKVVELLNSLKEEK
ncbi:uptake hydrogenase [Clostridium scatologenes]|uniref:Uptake hydrogenase n=2 Tax=Clostridium scatologenes TaxID=1548 RepID=A0A0E3GSH2_CLOSL|nr:NAD(P)H-dependent oxidoreductase subunit E [Clostridium scatologenes]AKA72066.1 uptake hydrogenase [Clostridium scatologenes]